ncbi:hypothetical protein [Hydrogenophaga sp.]|uniref:hypothetical protein n=1 Tax=Hydrogenophaga sp. TaxID=1904254 RepID=UPI003D151EB5
MKRSLLSLAVLSLAASVGAGAAAVPARHICLSDDDNPHSQAGVVRFLSQRIELAEGQTQTWVTVTRTGNFSDPRYGEFKITPTHLQEMVDNFNKRVLGQDVFLDVGHRHSDGAAAKFLKLSVENGRLRGLVEWTPYGVDAVKTRGFAYLSAEYHENWKDNEQGKAHGCVLLGAGLTTRPVIKQLEPVLLSLDDDASEGVRYAIAPTLIKELSDGLHMNYLEQLKTKLLAMGITGDVLTKLLAEAKAQLDAAAGDEAKCLSIVSTWEIAAKPVADQIKALAAAGNTQPITINLSAPNQVDVAGEVARLLAERDTQATAANTALQAKRKLLSDLIAAGDTTLPAEGVRQLCDAVSTMITAVTTDDQVKALAELQINTSKKLSAAHKLATLGYNPPSGSVQITVEASNGIKALQENVDRRLGFDRMSPARRFERTGGILLDENKRYAEIALAQFDSVNAARLDAEHRALAAGTGLVSDAAVPVIAERTVLREALYNLVSLNFVNVGTVPFANVVTIPYSYRDTSAAGMNALRRYENQGIRKAGVIQTHEEARPIPQKLAFRVTEELRMLLGASPIDFDPVSENIRNIIRIVGEDTEAINCNELVVSADEAGVAAGNDTLTASVNGTNAVFVTSQFPVVRPRKVYDIQGAQVGATVNPITVTLNSVARSEYLPPADGSALAAGIYWVMDYNLGELRFVDEDGAAVIPTNAWPLVVTYSYSTNVVKFNTDAVAEEDIKDRYDRLLTVIGGRKAVIASDRFFTPNMVLMSAAVDNTVSQARSFEANASRVATGLAADGSVGQIKAMPTFNTTAPGLLMADTRILIGERGNSRFRMVKPFAMQPLEQARNSNGDFIDAKESFGTQWVVSHTPTQLKKSLTSVVLYSSTGRVARAA